jgi:CCR4-NOT transcription complex subunit 1
MIPGQKMSPALVRYYEATLRVVLVISHDFPDFLCDFHFNFVNSLPEHCIQLRNIILSAQPRDWATSDPFKKSLKVDQIEEIKIKPKI